MIAAIPNVKSVIVATFEATGAGVEVVGVDGEPAKKPLEADDP